MNRTYNQDWNYEPFMYPTQEEVLDVNFQSIVSDCRAIIAGNLIPRSWSDISSTWHREDSEGRNHQFHKPEKARKSMSHAAREAWSKRERPTSLRLIGLHTKLVRTLQSNGMSFKEAHDKARELLGIK